MAKITYNNKVALITNPDIADENKITDNDMNEIKQVVNENAINISNEVDEDYRVNFLKGKNLINCNAFTSYSTTGVNVTTSKTDGLLDYINVTKSSSTSENIFISICNFTFSKETGTYNLSGCPSGGGESTYQLYFKDITTTQDVYPRNDGTPASVSLTKGHNYTLYLRLNASATFTDKKFYPMLLPTTETDTSYEPYITPSIKVDGDTIVSKMEKVNYFNSSWLESGFYVHTNSNYFYKNADGLITFQIGVKTSNAISIGATTAIMNIPNELMPKANTTFAGYSYQKGAMATYIRKSDNKFLIKPFVALSADDEINISGSYYLED